MTDIPILFGRFLVREGKISEDELAEVIKIQTELNQSFSTVALEGGFITIEDFKKALSHQRQKGISFKDALKELNIADDPTIERINKALKEKSLRLGEILVKRGLMTEEELEKALNEFKEKGVLKLL
jgi:hypothetical protein